MRIAHVARGHRCSSGCSAGAGLAASVVAERAGSALDPVIAARFVGGRRRPPRSSMTRSRLWNRSSRVSRPPVRSGWRDRSGGSRRSGTSPTSSGRSCRPLRRSGELATGGGGARVEEREVTAIAARGPRPRPGPGRCPGAHLGEAGAAHGRRVGASPAAPVLHRAGPQPDPFPRGPRAGAGAHHERIDGSGYHRGVGGGALTPDAAARRGRLLRGDDRSAPAPRWRSQPSGPPRSSARRPAPAARATRSPRCSRRPVSRRHNRASAGLTEREVEVLGLLARGLQTKEVAQRLASRSRPPTATSRTPIERSASRRAPRSQMFAMEHGLTAWKLPIGSGAGRS